MKKIIILAVVMILAAFVNAEAADKLKIGTIDLQRALNESEAGIKAKEELKVEVDKRDKALNAKQEELKKLKEEIESKAKVWNAETREKKEKEFFEKGEAFQKELYKMKEELNEARSERERHILNTLKEIIEELAAKESYTFILETSNGTVLYKPDNADITDKVIVELNKRKK